MGTASTEAFVGLQGILDPRPWWGQGSWAGSQAWAAGLLAAGALREREALSADPKLSLMP